MTERKMYSQMQASHDSDLRQPDEVMQIHDETEVLREELEHFRREKEKVRQLVGQIGGVKSSRRDHVITLTFLVLIVILFVIDTSRHLLHLNIHLPPLFSVQLGVLLVSGKIIWMMYRQNKVEHFQFWILNSIEFRLNQLARQLQTLNRRLASQPTEEEM